MTDLLETQKYEPLRRPREMEPHLFLSRAPVMGYVFRDGSYARFINHRFVTKLRSQIEEMQIVCEEGGNYYTDPNELIAQPEADPHAALREQIRKEVEAELLSRQKNTDMGTSTQGKLMTANSSSIRGAMADSNAQTAAGNPLAGVDPAAGAKSGITVADGVVAKKL